MQRNQAIAYNASNLDHQFTAHFPGYAGTTSGQSYHDQYQTNIHDTLSTINNSLASIGMNTEDFSSESSRLNAIHSHVQGAVGQTQAMQAMSEVSEELVTQTQSLRQIVSAQANMEATYYAQQMQKEASSTANMDNVIAAGSTEEVVYGSNPDNILHTP
jgi:P-type conjugative transfer protein TrbJ